MLIIQALYFMLPAYAANMAPVFAAKFFGSTFDVPVDFGYTVRGKRIFGSHKTVRGFVVGIAAAIAFVWLQRELYQYPFWNSIGLVPYPSLSVSLIGFLFGFGALAGDAIKSFFKRQMGVPPGGRWMPWDQIDFLIGALVFVGFVYVPRWEIIVLILLISPFLHIATNQIGYALGIKDTKW